MIKLSKKGDYALKAMVYLIENKGKRLKIEEIAKSNNISESFLRRVIADLDRADIIKSYKGRNGGVTIEKSLKNISVFDVLLAVGEELGVSDCSKGLDCKNLDICYTFPLYGELQKAINGILKIYTLDKVK